MRSKILLALAGLAALGGCSTTREDFNTAPALSPPGAGLYQYQGYVQPVGYQPTLGPRANSLFTDRNSDYFRDTRALDVGDIVTVRIAISDKAKLDNNSKRSRESGVDIGADVNPTYNGSPFLGTLGGKIGLTGGTNTAGKGTVDRSEKINLSVAAQVTQVLPNGNLFISGQQEIRVNYEVRVLSIAGVIRPGDILPDNTIPYDKIAEARISYGGRGRLTEVQQPGWGQQVLDAAMPY
ncbi:flagellar basal body L-ring protein FlgH [Aurantimonas sp. Leaf443]|uniref:flagellar basal body L-ring protein FlgH n=1 Tax=Aurantimonas sp. Leaf443 TaxID=1736378 RepID=UPI0006F87FB4|nr:flagellar basal body L-ring protein FlgH [Aurantimonas sp. Leaf443]KQT86017.1 flagellar biosynthesis protein FlgH [Aurantimonas sp. Leaf443]